MQSFCLCLFVTPEILHAAQVRLQMAMFSSDSEAEHTTDTESVNESELPCPPPQKIKKTL